MKRITLTTTEEQLVKDFRVMSAFDRKTFLVVAHAFTCASDRPAKPVKDRAEKIAARRAGA